MKIVSLFKLRQENNIYKKTKNNIYRSNKITYANYKSIKESVTSDII